MLTFQQQVLVLVLGYVCFVLVSDSIKQIEPKKSQQNIDIFDVNV
jgi:hypothetical protein